MTEKVTLTSPATYSCPCVSTTATPKSASRPPRVRGTRSCHNTISHSADDAMALLDHVLDPGPHSGSRPVETKGGAGGPGLVTRSPAWVSPRVALSLAPGPCGLRGGVTLQPAGRFASSASRPGVGGLPRRPIPSRTRGPPCGDGCQPFLLECIGGGTGDEIDLVAHPREGVLNTWPLRRRGGSSAAPSLGHRAPRRARSRAGGSSSSTCCEPGGSASAA